MSKDDSKLIDHLGGPAKVARLLGYSNAGGVQRVQNWKSRGIPPKVRLERPDLFPVVGLKDAPGCIGSGHGGRQPPSPAQIFDTVPEQMVVVGNFGDIKEL